MTDSLFDYIDEARRQRLRDLGWVEVYQWDQRFWQRPSDKALLQESEAFVQLARISEENVLGSGECRVASGE